MDGVFIYIFIICVVAIGITTILGIFAKGKRILKYIPTIFSALGGIGLFIKAVYFSSGFEDLGYIIYAMGAGIFFLAALVTAVVIEILLRKKVN